MTASARDGFSWPEFEHALATAYPVIFQRLAGRYHDPQLAEEVAWDSLTRAFEKLRDDPHYFDERNLTEWSSQLAGWRALDRLRKRSRTPSLVGDPFEDGLGVDRSVEPGRQDTQTLVRECLQRLDADDRDLLCSSYYDDLGDQAIGAARYADGTPTARGLRVWRRRQKAQARLRDLLLAAGYELPLDALDSQAL
jgi:DNA-directed RNA polymerase specialized sigma24 family protein